MLRLLLILCCFINAQANYFTSADKIKKSDQKVLSEVSFELWNRFFINKSIAFKNYSGKVLSKNDQPYLEIINEKTGQTFYQYFQKPYIQDDLAYQVQPTGNSIYQKKLAQFEKLKAIADLPQNPQLISHMDDSLRVMDEVHLLYREGLKILKKNQKEIRKHNRFQDPEDKKTILDINLKNTYGTVGDLGKVELNRLNGKIFIRIVHYATEISVGVFEEGSVDYKSKEMMKFVAKQHIAAGNTRQDKKGGRDLVVIEVKSFKEDIKNLNQYPDLVPQRTTSLNRHPMYSKKWWSEYWLAVKEAPSWNMLKFGIVNSSLQSVVVLSASAALNYIFGAELPGTKAAVVSFLWGTGFGTIMPMFKNWVYLPGAKYKSVLKNMLNGVLFQYVFTLTINGGNFAALGFNSIKGLMSNAFIIGGSYISNLYKPNLFNFAEINERIGKLEGFYEFQTKNKVLNIPFGFKWRRSLVAFQGMYYPAFVLRQSERILETAANSTGHHFLDYIGKASMFAAIPITEYMFMKYAEMVAAETEHPEALAMAKTARKDWINKYQLLYDYNPVSFSKRVMKKLKIKLPKSSGDSCAKLLLNFTRLAHP